MPADQIGTLLMLALAVAIFYATRRRKGKAW